VTQIGNVQSSAAILPIAGLKLRVTQGQKLAQKKGCNTDN